MIDKKSEQNLTRVNLELVITFRDVRLEWDCALVEVDYFRAAIHVRNQFNYLGDSNVLPPLN